MPRSSTRHATQRRWEGRSEIRVGGRPVVALRPADRRVDVGLVMPVGDRVIDVSIQPAAACAALTDAARWMREPMNVVDAAARRVLAEVAAEANAWSPSAQRCLPGAFGGVAFPLLAASYDAGAVPLGEVPRWAAPVLASTTIAEGAAVAFRSKATRPVRRALVDAVGPLPSGAIDLTALCLAMMGCAVLEPDRLARVLGSDRSPQTVSQLPDAATLRAARPILDDWGPLRTERVLAEAAGHDGGLALLLDTIRYALQLGDHGPAHPLPNRLRELHDEHRALMRTATNPATPRVGPPAGAVPPAPPAPPRRPDRPPHPVLAPPIGGPTVRQTTPLATPAVVLALDGRRTGDLEFVVPRTVGDLDRWGRLLSNCLGDYGPAAATGRSILIGVIKRSRLAYAVELTPGGRIQQFCGRANRRPLERDRLAVVEALVAARVLHPPATA